MKLEVRKFDPASMKPHRIILAVGRRGSGKSFLMRDLMSQVADKVDFGLAMTPTEDTAGMFREHMPSGWIYNSYNAGKLEAMLAMQREFGRTHKQRRLFVLMDDCMYDKKVLRSTSMRDLFMNGRHMHVTFVNAMQYVMDMPPDLRTQVDYVFVFKENILSNKIKLWKYFYGMFEKFEDFQRVMDRCCESYGCLVLDNTVPSSRIEDCVFWYRARLEVPPFRMGADVYWRLSEALAKTEDEREGSAFLEGLQRQKPQRISCVEKRDEHGKPTEEGDGLTLLVN
jgi:hypothetical protein